MTWNLELINLAEQMLRTGRTWLVLHPAVATEKKTARDMAGEQLVPCWCQNSTTPSS